MSIANELSSEVATAVLTRQEDEHRIDPQEVGRILLLVHDTLRHLQSEERKRNAVAIQPDVISRALPNAPSSSSNH